MIVLKNFLRSMRHAISSLLRVPRSIVRFPHVRIHGVVSIGPGCSFGVDVSLYGGCTLAQSTIGDFSYVGGGSVLKNCAVGKFCSIAPNVQIGLGMHPTDMISTYPGFYSPSASGAVRIAVQGQVVETLPVTIGNDVWIGNNAMIMDGVTIGNGAIIAAGAIVTANVEPYRIIAGAPARAVRQRFSEAQIAFLEEFRWWDRGLEFCVVNARLFADPSAFFRKYMNDAGGSR